MLPFSHATCSTSPCQYRPSWNGGWKDLFQLGFFFKKTSKISNLFIMIPEVHNRTMSPAVEVSSLSGQSDLSFCACQEIMITGLLDIKVSRLEQENDALLWAKYIQLLWHWWFLDISFLSKFSFLLHFPAFLSEHLFRQSTSFVERWCALLASASQKWKAG